MNLLGDAVVIAGMLLAWTKSRPDDPAQRHEEGGYILIHSDGSYRVEIWETGERDKILPPPLDTQSRYNGLHVEAAFHTPPNPPVDESGLEWEQAPSRSDCRWHQRHRIMGFVISRSFIYEIAEDGRVKVAGNREQVLRI